MPWTFSHHAGGVAGPVAELLAGPDGFPGILVQSHQAGLIAAGHHDQPIAVHQRRLADVPLGILALEILQDVAVPQVLPSCGLQAGQVAVLGQHVDAVLLDGGGAPGTGSAAMVQSIPQGELSRGSGRCFPRGTTGCCRFRGCPERRSGLPGWKRSRSLLPGRKWTRPGTVPPAGHCRSSPVSVERPVLSGPRHWGHRPSGKEWFDWGSCTWLQEARTMTVAISAAVGSLLWLMAVLLSLKMAALYTFAAGLGPIQLGLPGVNAGRRPPVRRQAGALRNSSSHLPAAGR